MSADNLPINGFVLPAEIVELDQITRIEPTDVPLLNVPAKYWPGVSYTAPVDSGANMAPDQLENVSVGIQEHSVNPDTALKIEGKSEIDQNSEGYKIAVKVQKQSAHSIAFDAQKKRVSRRLLLAERSKKLNIVCPVTGIVSLIEYPAIPYKTLIYTHPLSDLSNCRGIAQQGEDYLRRLDTQTLAGILMVLADTYELFKFQPFDTGAQKNAILRTAGKDQIIDAILMIETMIHSMNCSFLPKLSLVFDSNLEQFGLGVRMQSYLKILADAIAKPDKEAYDPSIKKVGRPLYIRDVEKAERKVSFLARQEIAKAKKEYAEDRKAGKIAIVELCKAEKVSDKLKILLGSLMAEDALLGLIPEEMINLICIKLETFNASQAQTLIKILKKDRKALTMDVAELEATFEEEVEAEEQDDPAPGNEAAIEDNEHENENSQASEEVDILQNESGVSEMLDMDTEQESKVSTKELVPPAGLSSIERILWKKKMQAAAATVAPKKAVQNNLPSVASYVPAGDTVQHTTVLNYDYQANRLYVVGNLSNSKRIFFVVNDFGVLVPVKSFSEWDAIRSYE